MGLVVEAWPAHVRRRGPLEHAFLFGVAVEAGHRAQATGDGCPRPSTGLEVAGEALDVGPPRCAQANLVLLAPADELAQVQGIGVASQASVAREERSERVLLDVGEHGIDESDFGCRGSGHVAPPGQRRDPEASAPGPDFRFGWCQRSHDLPRSTGGDWPRTRTPRPPTRAPSPAGEVEGIAVRRDELFMPVGKSEPFLECRIEVPKHLTVVRPHACRR